MANVGGIYWHQYFKLLKCLDVWARKVLENVSEKLTDGSNLKNTNRSMDFLEMIKNKPVTQKESVGARTSMKLNRTISHHTTAETFAVIDTETNWYDEVMSIGIALADSKTFKCVGAKYYIIDPEYRKGGMYSDVMNVVKSIPAEVMSREDALSGMAKWLNENRVTQLYAYNARFDKGHLQELCDFEWYDIMRLAAYKQYNKCIPKDAECCKTGRLKRGYAVEDILKMLSGDFSYSEVHNAVMDAIDELKIMELMGHPLDVYACGKL